MVEAQFFSYSGEFCLNPDVCKLPKAEWCSMSSFTIKEAGTLQLAKTVPKCLFRKTGLGHVFYEGAEQNQELSPILPSGAKLRKSSKTINLAAHKVSKKCLCN